MLSDDQGIEVVRAIGQIGLKLAGNGDANRLYGSTGNDTLDGKGGGDPFAGGGGNDRYFVRGAGDHVIEHAGAGFDTVMATVSYRLNGG